MMDDSLFIRRTEHLKLRVGISLLMLFLAFVGVVATNFSPYYAWRYWCIISFVFAFMSVGLSFLTAKSHQLPYTIVIRETLHWLALIIMVYLVAILMHFGILSNVLAGLFVLTLLTLTTLLAGIHFDLMYLLVGLVLAIFAIISAAFVQYFMVIALVTIVTACILLAWQFRKRIAQLDN